MDSIHWSSYCHWDTTCGAVLLGAMLPILSAKRKRFKWSVDTNGWFHIIKYVFTQPLPWTRQNTRLSFKQSKRIQCFSSRLVAQPRLNEPSLPYYLPTAEGRDNQWIHGLPKGSNSIAHHHPFFQYSKVKRKKVATIKVEAVLNESAGNVHDEPQQLFTFYSYLSRDQAFKVIRFEAIYISKTSCREGLHCRIDLSLRRLVLGVIMDS